MVKRFASPGSDSSPSEVGVYASGAGLHPDSLTAKSGALPFDWHSNNPAIDNDVQPNLIGNFNATRVSLPISMRTRNRGISPWGGSFAKYKTGYRAGKSFENQGGSVDHNAGASSLIAGGPGAASSLVRVGGAKKTNEGVKLPVLPKQVVRGGRLATPATGGQAPSSGASAPITPKIYGFPSIVKVLMNPSAAKGL